MEIMISYLIRILMNKAYVSVVECNIIIYLTSMGTKIPCFHNQQEYREELSLVLVRRVHGLAAKFPRATYVQSGSVAAKHFAKCMRTCGNR